MARPNSIAILYVVAIVLSIAIAVASVAWGGEVEEVAKLAPKYGGETEVRLYDGSRVDLLTDSVAYEADWSSKWAEGVGQALHYAELTGKRPGLILLVKDPAKEWRSMIRAARLCGRYSIELRIEVVDLAK